MTASSVIGYYGSKHGIAEQVVALMPAHRGYIEPYAGSLNRPLSTPALLQFGGDA